MGWTGAAGLVGPPWKEGWVVRAAMWAVPPDGPLARPRRLKGARAGAGAEAGAGVGAVILFRACSAPCARLASRSGSGNSSLIHGALSRCCSLASSLPCQLQSSPGPACQSERTARFAPSVQARLQVEIELACAAGDGQPARRHRLGHGAATHTAAASAAPHTAALHAAAPCLASRVRANAQMSRE